MHSTVSRALRHIVFERDSYTCVLCDRGGADCHHIIPRGRGGRNTPQNLVTLCRMHHMILHHEIQNSDPRSVEDMKLTLLEYISDHDPESFYENAADWRKYAESGGG